MGQWTVVLGVTAVLGICSADATARADVVGRSEFLANTSTVGDQRRPAVAMGAFGYFFVVWQGPGDGSSDGIFARAYDSTGAPVGPDFQVNTYTPGAQADPAVVGNPSGVFLVAWGSEGSPSVDTDGTSVQARFFDSFGVPLAPQFVVNAYTTSNQGEPSVAADATGNFIAAWSSRGSAGSDTSGSSIQVKRFTQVAIVDGDFQANTYTSGYQALAKVAAGDDGGFVVVWHGDGSNGDDSQAGSIHARPYDSSALPLANEFQVNTYTPYNQTYPGVGADATGNFVVVWTTPFALVSARRYSSAGTPLSGEFQVSALDTLSSTQGSGVAVDDLGRFLVTWQDYDSPGDDRYGVRGRLYASDGNALGDEFQVNTYTTDQQREPAVAAGAEEAFVVAWSGIGQDGSYGGIAGKRFTSGRPVQGKRLLVKNPNGSEVARAVVTLAKEPDSTIDLSTMDPRATGATLRVVSRGTTSSDVSYELDAAGWTSIPNGYKYTGPTTGDPVKKALIRSEFAGTAQLKVILKGNVGTQSLDVVPPDAGDEGGIVLDIHGGDAFCAAFGGDAGGVEARDDGRLWKIVNAVVEGCPAP